MTLIPHQKDIKCFAPCEGSKIESGLCHCFNRTQNEALNQSCVRLSLLDKVKEIAFGDGSAQERMVDIKALFSNEA